jgi:hypothetical protein
VLAYLQKTKVAKEESNRSTVLRMGWGKKDNSFASTITLGEKKPRLAISKNQGLKLSNSARKLTFVEAPIRAESWEIWGS